MRGPWYPATPRYRYGSPPATMRSRRRPRHSDGRTQLLLRWQRCITSQLGGGVTHRMRKRGVPGRIGRGDGPADEPRKDSLRPSGPQRLAHRSRHNLATTTRRRTIGDALTSQTDSSIGTLWHPNRHPRHLHRSRAHRRPANTAQTTAGKWIAPSADPVSF